MKETTHTEGQDTFDFVGAEKPLCAVIKEPMLATGGDIKSLRFPVFATPKLDGIRCLTLPTTEAGKKCRAVSRKFKPIPNRYIRQWVEENLPAGLDGELMIVGEGNKPLSFQACSSGVMSHGGESNFRYYVFDCVKEDLKEPYVSRCQRLQKMRLPRVRVEKILPVQLGSIEEVEDYEARCLSEGYEGVMVRSGDSPYKCGRSTRQEGWLLKIKRFQDSEAKIVGVAELQRNTNEQKQDAFGYAERSSKMGGKVSGTGMAGNISVVDVRTGKQFAIGTGFDFVMRTWIWENRKEVVGSIVKYKFQPTGVKEAPRFPVFVGFRSEDDM